MSEIVKFIKELRNFKPEEDVFNPWKDYDRNYDVGSSAPKIRAYHLERFLEQRAGLAKIALIGEAVGYQGARFSGIPLVSERMLLGNCNKIHPSFIVSIEANRTSNPECGFFKYRTQSLKGFAEPTATIIWEAIRDNGLSGDRVVTWNTFPFHPFSREKGLMSNRTPRESEVKVGMEFLRSFIHMFPEAKLIAVGKTAQRALNREGVDCIAVPHPANGGANDFRAGFHAACAYLSE